MTLFPDEPVGVVGQGGRTNIRIHIHPEACPYAPDETRPTEEDDLRAGARKCVWCSSHGGE